jgi:hypothetical protein
LAFSKLFLGQGLVIMSEDWAFNRIDMCAMQLFYQVMWTMSLYTALYLVYTS